MDILLYLAIGLVIGAVSGTLGIGGGVLLVPALIWLCGFDQPKAAGTSLAVLVPPIGLLAAWKYFLHDQMDVKAAVWIALAFVVGAYGGAALLTGKHIPLPALRLGFGLLMVYIGARFLVASNTEAATVAAGLIAAGLAWLGYLGLRMLGRRHLPKPDLGANIRTMREQGHGDIDYHI